MEQALADFAELITHLKEKNNAPNAQVITFGGRLVVSFKIFDIFTTFPFSTLSNKVNKKSVSVIFLSLIKLLFVTFNYCLSFL